MQQIVFLTLFLGLTSGSQTVTVATGPAVKSVRIVLDSRATTIEHPPWTARVDFGRELTPRDLVAIAYDGEGNEVARTSQTLNLPRRIAEVEIALTQLKDGGLGARLVGTHRQHRAPRRASLSVDGKRVKLDRDFSARLPSVDWSHTHVVSAEMRFDDGEVARRETVVQGGFADSTSSQLTPVAVTAESDRGTEALEDCLSVKGNRVHVSAVEKTNAIVVFVKDPDATSAMDAVHSMMPPSRDWSMSGEHWVVREKGRFRRERTLDSETTIHVTWPIAQRYGAPGEPTYDLFNSSEDVAARDAGVPWLLTRRWLLPPDALERRRFTDAVAVAGISALNQGRRRAVVLLLSDSRDQSDLAPDVVRRYLERVGVPLFVWSLDGPRPDVMSTWGRVEDISTLDALDAAIAKLNRALVSQRIAWIAADPVSALHVRADERCGVTPLAREVADPFIQMLPPSGH